MGGTATLAKVWKAAPGALFSDEQAQVYGEYLQELASGKWPVTSELILRKALARRNPLHDYFEWDDHKAGHLYRMDQARELTNHLIVVRVEGDAEIEEKAFFNVTVRERVNGHQSHRGYVSIDDVLASPELRQQVMERSRKEFQSFMRRYRRYKEWEPLFRAYEQLELL